MYAVRTCAKCKRRLPVTLPGEEPKVICGECAWKLKVAREIAEKGSKVEPLYKED